MVNWDLELKKLLEEEKIEGVYIFDRDSLLSILNILNTEEVMFIFEENNVDILVQDVETQMKHVIKVLFEVFAPVKERKYMKINLEELKEKINNLTPTEAIVFIVKKNKIDLGALAR
ncbi:MAG: hypothetical protein NC925_02610 [Candidatus Omnitrophica bacterium]|nr:hypothetical protein [Candidatus Omnitrophota bacterium]